jgi:hypothetical protein
MQLPHWRARSFGSAAPVRALDPANHQATENLSITHSQLPSCWCRATSGVTVPSESNSS